MNSLHFEPTAAHETRVNEDQFPIWKNAFAPAVRHGLIDEDIFAGKSVCGVLISVLAAGLFVGIVSVVVITLFG